MAPTLPFFYRRVELLEIPNGFSQDLPVLLALIQFVSFGCLAKLILRVFAREFWQRPFWGDGLHLF